MTFTRFVCISTLVQITFFVSSALSQPGIPELATPTSVIGPDPSLVVPPFTGAPLGGAQEGVIPQARVFRNSSTLAIDLVQGSIVVPGATTPEQAAMGFLTANHAALNLSSSVSELVLDRQFQSGVAKVLFYKQIFGGLNVLYGGVSVTVRSDLTVSMASFNHIPINQPPPSQNYNPTNSAQAINAAIKTLNGRTVNNPQPIAEAVVHVKNGTPTVAWLIQFRNSILAQWEVLIDATTLQPIEVHSMVTVN